MQVRRQPITQAIAWMRQAINLGARNPRAIFGAALLMMGVLYLSVMLLLSPVSLTLNAGSDINAVLPWMVPAYVVLFLLFPVLLGGLMHVIREAESGRQAKASGLFAPFRQGRAGQLALLGFVQLLLAVLSTALVVGLAGGEYWTNYLAALRSAAGGVMPETMPAPNNPGLMTLVQMVYNYFSFALTLLGVPLILFSKLPVTEALRAALRATLVNFPANFLAGAMFFGGSLLLGVFAVVFVLIAVWIGGLLHPAFGSLLGFVILIIVGMVLLVVLTGAAYFAWRDTFGEQDDAPPPARGPGGSIGIEV